MGNAHSASGDRAAAIKAYTSRGSVRLLREEHLAQLARVCSATFSRFYFEDFVLFSMICAWVLVTVGNTHQLQWKCIVATAE